MLSSVEYSKKLPKGEVIEFCIKNCVRIPEIENIKELLDKTKNRIDSLDQKWTWSINNLNLYRALKGFVSHKLGAQLVTNAWFKMFEILNYISFKSGEESIKSFHLCEAPGAFISALNHYLDTKSRGTGAPLDWYAETLIHPGNALEIDKGLMAKYPERWLFGDKKNGDITDPINIRSFHRAGNVYNIVTADGAKDVGVDYNEQEIINSKIILGEMITMLGTLKEGGTFIIKLFTIHESITISVIYYLSCIFENVKLVKPHASKASNSEIYVVCEGYLLCDKDDIEFLLGFLEGYPDSPSYEKQGQDTIHNFIIVPKKFIGIIAKVADELAHSQIAAIEYVINNIKNPKSEEQARKDAQQFSFDWTRTNNIIRIKQSLL